ncbi:MAG: NUDIX domain-containing protein [Cytophagia bacterium]|nr:NUDIX domain-containing protein [Cytophagia bacterium]NBW35555.1 NUDIX domain-containing protein [Cytophagia bacterium]
MTDRPSLILALQQYQTKYKEEMNFISSFLFLLQHQDAYQRTHLPGHITGSAWIVDRQREFVLLTHHAKLNKWLQPGGHADGDEHVLNVALREAEEETGVKHFKILHRNIFDLDIHPIPARKDFGAHDHYDIRFLLEADMNEPLVITEESHDLAWVPLKKLSDYNDSPSLLRMAEKIKLF